MEEKEIMTGVLTPKRLAPLMPYLENDEITDVDWDGSHLWVNTIHNERQRIDNSEVTPEYINALAAHISNNSSKQLNKKEEILETEVGAWRITCLHNSVAISGTAIFIRKTTLKPRLNYEKLIKEKYCDEKMLNLLINCLLAKYKIIICGEPESGKTELAKWLAMYIPDTENNIIVEDTPEWHYKELKPNASAIEIKVNENFTYVDAMKIIVRLNPKRMMLSEVRGVEAMELIDSWSEGTAGITTLHTDAVKKIPDRILNMMPTRQDAERLRNNVYENLDIGIKVCKKIAPDGSRYRCIDEVGFFARENEKNCFFPYYDAGKYVAEFPDAKLKKFYDANITDPFHISAEMRSRKFE